MPAAGPSTTSSGKIYKQQPMKKLFTLVFAACALMAAAISCYDDSALKGEIDSLKDRVSTLEDQIKTANSNISALQDVVRALENKLYVNSVSETSDGYILKFSDGTTATIKNGNSPVVSADKYNDVYYWTVNGEWLLDKDGKKIPVTGTAPELKIENGRWLLSTDGGKTWTDIGQATGDPGVNGTDGTNGTDGDSFFQSVEWDENYVYLTLKGGTVVFLPRMDIMNIFKSIQSIVYVPDYDDLKITVNSAVISSGNDAVLFDQPTEITYQILPSQYAPVIAEGLRSFYSEMYEGMLPKVGRWMNHNGAHLNLDSSWLEWRDALKSFGRDFIFAWLDVKPLKTRSGGANEEPDYGMRIIDIVSADASTGEITFKVLPENIACESFLNNGLQPSHYATVKDNEGSWSVPVWKYSDLKAYQNRSSFAVQLRLYHYQDSEEYEESEDFYYENEIASTYTTLYPNVLEPVELLMDPYIPDKDGHGLAKVDGEEIQYLRYDVFRNEENKEEPGYRTILKGVTPAYVINGKKVSAEEAYELGYMIPNIEQSHKDVTFEGGNGVGLFVGVDDYIEVEMSEKASEAEREAAIGTSVVGTYTFETPFGPISCSGKVVIIKDEIPVTYSDYDFLHLSYYTFNSKKEEKPFIFKYDFDSNDGSVEWWTKVNPRYYTEGPGMSADRVSFRHALADYDPGIINLAELAFNVVDSNDNVLSQEEMDQKGLEVQFVYKDSDLEYKSLPDNNVTGKFKKYNDLWVDKTIFYFNTNEYSFIPMKAKLYQNGKEIPTRFSVPRKSATYISVDLDYSSFALVNWVPFKDLTAEDITITLDEHKIVRIPLFQTVNLKDNRPNGVSYYVIKEGRWIIGNVSSFDYEAGTYTTGGNGYIVGVSAKEAYHFNNDIEFELTGSGIPTELKRIIKILYSGDDGYNFDSNYQEGYLPWLTIDYTSEIEFRGMINIPVHLKLSNPWQPDLETDFTITINGSENGGNGGGSSDNKSWIGSWRVSRRSVTGEEFYDTWEISQSADGNLLISGIGGFTDQEFTACASEDNSGNLLITSQKTGMDSDPAMGRFYLLLSGQYNINGITSNSSTEGILLATGIMSDDGKTASLRPGTSSDGYDFINILFLGQSATPGTVNLFEYNYDITPIPQTITRIN